MTNFNIIRPLTDTEKTDIISVDSVEFLSAFLKELAKVQSKYQSKYLPYDLYNARMDFEEYSIAKASSIASSLNVNEENYKLDFDFEKYGELSRFTFLEQKDAKTIKLKDGIMQEVNIGVRYRFICKPRGNKISLFVPINKVESFEKWLKKNFTDKKENPVVESSDIKDDKE
ncbi:hypothetical protein KAI04_04855 [Candidatus Pacearchaeota archaeon]|nr:hypothetical protein [Candidatus Pacearchaeota archaeon]